MLGPGVRERFDVRAPLRPWPESWFAAPGHSTKVAHVAAGVKIPGISLLSSLAGNGLAGVVAFAQAFRPTIEQEKYRDRTISTRYQRDRPLHPGRSLPEKALLSATLQRVLLRFRAGLTL